MKKIQKLLLMGAALFATFGFVGCQEDEFTPGEKDSGAQVYFPTSIATEQQVDDDVTSLTLPVKRVETAEQLTVYIAAEYDTAMFSIPETVSFAAGEDTANLVVTFKSTLVTGQEYPISLLINDPANITQYGYSQLNITVTVWPWVYLGEGQFRDDWLTTMYNVGNPNINVPVYEHKAQPGVYMIENMFGWTFLTETFGMTQAEVEAQVGITYTDTNILLDCSDPTQVVFPMQDSGIVDNDPTYGAYQIATIEYGTLVDGIVTFPAKGLMFGCAKGQDYSNNNGLFRLVLPGVELTDYSLAAAYGGMRVAADNITTTAVVDFTYGADVAAINYVIAEGKLDSDPSQLYAAIVAGGDNVYSVATDGSGKVSVEAQLDAAKFYTFAAMPVSAAGAVVEKNAMVTSFYFAGIEGTEIPECDIQVVLLTTSEAYADNQEVLDAYPDYSSMVWAITGTEIAAISIYAAPASVIDNLDSYDMTVEDVIANYGSVLPEQALAILEENGIVANLMQDLEDDTEYKIIAYGRNDYGKEAYVVSEGLKTAAIPYDGDLQLGDYYMSYQDASSADLFFESVFTLKPIANTNTEFRLQCLGTDKLDDQFLATYDAAAGTLTLSGELVGQEPDNYFGSLLYYYDANRTAAVGYYNFASESSEGGDPCVFKVENNKPVQLMTTLMVPVIRLEDGKTLDYLGYYPAGTAVTPYAPEAALMSVRPAQSLLGKDALDNNVLKMDGFIGSAKTVLALDVVTGVCKPLTKDYSRVALIDANVEALK